MSLASAEVLRMNFKKINLINGLGDFSGGSDKYTHYLKKTHFNFKNVTQAFDIA